MSGHGNSSDARGVLQQRMAQRTHLHGHHRFHLHLLLSHPCEVAVHPLQEAPPAAAVISGEHEARTRAGTRDSQMDRTIGRSHHRWLPDHLPTRRLHLLHRVRREKRSASEFNYFLFSLIAVN